MNNSNLYVPIVQKNYTGLILIVSVIVIVIVVIFFSSKSLNKTKKLHCTYSESEDGNVTQVDVTVTFDKSGNTMQKLEMNQVTYADSIEDAMELEEYACKDVVSKNGFTCNASREGTKVTMHGFIDFSKMDSEDVKDLGYMTAFSYEGLKNLLIEEGGSCE